MGCFTTQRQALRTDVTPRTYLNGLPPCPPPHSWNTLPHFFEMCTTVDFAARLNIGTWDYNYELADSSPTPRMCIHRHWCISLTCKSASLGLELEICIDYTDIDRRRPSACNLASRWPARLAGRCNKISLPIENSIIRGYEEPPGANRWVTLKRGRMLRDFRSWF